MIHIPVLEQSRPGNSPLVPDVSFHIPELFRSFVACGSPEEAELGWQQVEGRVRLLN